MFHLSLIGTGALLGLTAGISPGPVSTLTISKSITSGYKEGLKFIFLILFIDILIATFILKTLVHFTDLKLFVAIISICGGLFLGYMGLNIILKPFSQAEFNNSEKVSIRETVAIAFLNPNVYIFWTSIAFPIIAKYELSANLILNGFMQGFYFAMLLILIIISIAASSCKSYMAGNKFKLFLKFKAALLILFSLILFRFGYLSLLT